MSNVWWQGRCECSICGHWQQSVVPIDEDQDSPVVPLECGECGNMTASPVEVCDES